MAQVNFPVATAAGQVFSPSTGVTYIYVGTPPNGYWSGTSSVENAAALDARYFLKTGGTVSGNVSVGTPSEDGTTAGSQLGTNGKIVAARSGAGNEIFEGYLIGDSSPNVVLNNDGSASFGGNSVSIDSTGAYTGTNQIRVNRTDAGTYCFEGQDNGTQTSLITKDGSATFNGEVVSGTVANGTSYFRHQASDNITTNNPTDDANVDVYKAFSSVGGSFSQKIGFKADGSATFAGDVEVGSSNRFVKCRQSTGAVVVSSDNASTSVFSGQLNQTTKASILADGSASFVGGITRINNLGSVLVGTTGNNLGDALIALNQADGSATFDSNVISKAEPYGGVNVGAKLDPSGSCIATADNSNVFWGFQSGNSTPTSTIHSGGAASFAGDVEVGDITNGPAIKLYSHGYLDVRGDATAGTGGISVYNGAVQPTNRTIFLDPVGSAIYAGNVTAFSDIRLKKDIEVIPNALEKILSLRGVTYTDIATDDRRTGVIAQEVQEVLPEAVQGNEEYLSVAYGNMVGILIEAVKQLEERVRELEGN